MNEVTELPQAITSLSKSFGGVAGVSGEGANKVAYQLGADKVLLRYKEHKAPKEHAAEYFKSQYYLHQILQTVFPDNFPHVRLATGENAVVVDQVTDTPDFIEAKRIRGIMNERGYGGLSGEEKLWVQGKGTEIKSREDFKQVSTFLQDTLLTSVNNDPDELASPWNSVVVGNNLVMLDLFDPDTRGNPTLDEGSFTAFLSNARSSGKLEQNKIGLIKSFYERYKKNVNVYLSAQK